MRRLLETVPKDGKVVILEDDASGIYELAHWSIEERAWVGENGKPSTITPPIGMHCSVMNTFCQSARNIFCKENVDRAPQQRRSREGATSSLCPRAGLRL